MNLMLRATILAAFCACAVAARAADAVDLYYFVNQKLFKVSLFENGLPKLDQEVDPSEAPDPSSLANQAWQVRGSLPLDPELAAPAPEYGLWRPPLPYARRFEEPRLGIRLSVRESLDALSWKGGGADDFFVFGWVDRGAIRSAFVTQTDAKGAYQAAAKLEAPESAAAGNLYVWRISNGEVVARAPAEFDALYFDAPVEANEYARLAKIKDAGGATALHHAARAGRADAIAPLLAARGRLRDARDKQGRTPLAYAAAGGRVESVRALLKAGASAADGENFTDSAIHEASQLGHFDSVATMAPEPPRASKQREQFSWALAAAINQNQSRIAQHLFGIGAKVEASKDARGGWVLKAFINGYPELGLLLLEKFEVSPTYSQNGYGFFHAVAPYADNELLDRLLALGVDLKQRSGKGALPMDVAVGLGNVEAICWFIDHGGRGSPGEGIVDPVFHAIREGQPESVSCLIDYGFDVNREISEGVTPLMYAVYEGEAEIARSIAAAGGIWEFDSLRMDRVLTKVLELDAADLLASALDQGWARDRLLFTDFSLRTLARFYGAERSLAELARRDWPDGGLALLSPSEADQPPKLTRGLEVEYPEDLQQRFGEREAIVTIALGSLGVSAAIRCEAALEPELQEVVVRAVERMTFEPAIAEGIPVAVRLKLKVPLAVDMSDENVFELADTDTKPRALSMASPAYPHRLYEVGMPGRVVVQFVLDGLGNARRLQIVSSTHHAFEAPALACVRNSKWSPAMKDGKPVAVRVRVPIVFNPR